MAVSEDIRLLPTISEITSALGTVGLLSMNFGPEFAAFGKLLVAGVMFWAGRSDDLAPGALGPAEGEGYIYTQEDIAIG